MTQPKVDAIPAPRSDVPRLTVLMPSWNAAATIEAAIASVLEERTVPLECLVVDDGSTDGTPDLVEAIAEADPRVVLLPLPANQGVSNARNAGLAIARGEWLAFLDADDRLLPGGVAALMRPTADPSIRVVIGQRIWSDGDRTWISRFYDIPDITEPGRKSIATHPGLLYYASATGKAIHRSLVADLRFEGRVLGDQPWTIRGLLRAGGDIEVIGDVVYEWQRPHPDRYVPTITAATRASADRAAEAATVARGAYLAVSAEVDAQIDDPATRLAVKHAYLDRLIRSDLGGPVGKAIERRDPATGVLYDAMGRFLAAVPPAILASSEPVFRSILVRPGRQWASLVPDARSAYWRMVRPALRADPGLARRVADRRGLALALTLVRRLPAALGPIAASTVMQASIASRRRPPTRPPARRVVPRGRPIHASMSFAMRSLATPGSKWLRMNACWAYGRSRSVGARSRAASRSALVRTGTATPAST